MQILQTILSNAAKKITGATPGLPPSLYLAELENTNKWQQAQLIIFINPQHKHDNVINKILQSHKSLATAPILSYKEGDIPPNARNPRIILNSAADEKLFQQEIHEARRELDEAREVMQEYDAIQFSATLAAMKISGLNTNINLQNIKNATKDIKGLVSIGNCSDAEPLKTIPNEPQEFAIAYRKLAYVKAAEKRFDAALDKGNEILEQKNESDLAILSHALEKHTTKQKVLILHGHTSEYFKGLKDLCQGLNVSYALIKPA